MKSKQLQERLPVKREHIVACQRNPHSRAERVARGEQGLEGLAVMQGRAKIDLAGNNGALQQHAERGHGREGESSRQELVRRLQIKPSGTKENLRSREE